ncbi:TetR family transcriptional regulator [Nocardia neocaledoniensis]|uniref:TetR family transcriptional regulator n=2 Tax=Nocardia neocaledoniensis TaxID=236511 RepID=A0A317P571_9NOCA|nr:TetR/AcrR family transcriptional regulator [Nocardia neocaledoniensis]PWV81368.1 TetR family transcriptional regulator [Nocardia neocaledoniensis]
MTADSRVEPALRADARRNRALVLAAAQRALAERGAAVSLAEVARRAGVGAGTVHRHFPTKTDLLEAVMQQRVDRLAALAGEHLADPDPGAAFFALCTHVIVTTPGNKDLCDLVQSDDGWPRALLRGAGNRFQRALGALLSAAQRQGSVRPDVTVAEVLELFTGCVAIQRLRPVGSPPAPSVVLVLEALRAHPRSVTEPARADRDETPRRDESPAVPTCPVCAGPVRRSGTGRPARYCSPACRQKAHRRRHPAPTADR